MVFWEFMNMQKSRLLDNLCISLFFYFYFLFITPLFSLNMIMHLGKSFFLFIIIILDKKISTIIWIVNIITMNAYSSFVRMTSQNFEEISMEDLFLLISHMEQMAPFQMNMTWFTLVGLGSTLAFIILL
jgi:hypothetical protein